MDYFSRLTNMFLIALATFVAASVHLLAQGPSDLMVAPTRVVFEGQTRSVNVSLINTGTDTNSYVITMYNYRMTEDGNLEQIAEPDSGQNFADKIVRYFPRQVVLAPKEEQTLRLQLTGVDNLPEGEYRSHVYLRGIPRARVAETLAADTVTSGISMQLTPIYGIILPIIVRHGDVTVAVDIPKVELDTTSGTQPRAVVHLQRWGTSSTYGDLAVNYHPAGGGEPVQIGISNGIAVYAPNPSRTLSLPLNLPPGVNLHGGKLTVEYRSRSNYRERTLAQAEIEVP